jgi:hypothetical protein
MSASAGIERWQKRKRLFEPNQLSGKACRRPVETRRSLHAKKFHQNYRATGGPQSRAMLWARARSEVPATGRNGFGLVSEMKRGDREEGKRGSGKPYNQGSRRTEMSSAMING